METILLGFVLVIASVFEGWVVKILWDWFMVPVFHLPDISPVQGIGLVLTVTILTVIFSDVGEGESWKDYGRDMLRLVAVFLVLAVIAWFVHLF